MGTVLLALGCGEDENDGPAATTTTTETERESDERIAEQAGLVLDDFPMNWQQADEKNESEPSECSGVQEARAAASARASSPRFSHGNSTLAESVIYLYADEATADEAFAGLVSQETRACIGQEIGRRAGEREKEGLDFGVPATSRVLTDALGDEHDTSRVTIPVRSQGIDVEIIDDLVVVRVERGIANFVLADTVTPFDEDLRAHLTSAVVRRLEAGLDPRGG